LISDTVNLPSLRFSEWFAHLTLCGQDTATGATLDLARGL
jgi:hypothetical protein